MRGVRPPATRHGRSAKCCGPSPEAKPPKPHFEIETVGCINCEVMPRKRVADRPKNPLARFRIMTPPSDKLTYSQCMWFGNYLVNMLQEMPSVYVYKDDRLTYIGVLPHRPAMLRIMRGYAWMIDKKQCTICCMASKIFKIATVPIYDTEHAEIIADSSATWFIMRVVYETAFTEHLIDVRGNIRAIMCLMTHTQMDDRPRIRVISVPVAYGAVMGYDEHGVLYRDSLTSESVTLWRPGREITTFRPCDMLTRPSHVDSEFHGEYYVSIHDDRISYICAKGYQGVIWVSTKSGAIVPEEYSGEVTYRSISIGGHLCQFMDDGRKFVDVTDGFRDITELLRSFCRNNGEEFDSVGYCTSGPLVTINCKYGTVYAVSITRV